MFDNKDHLSAMKELWAVMDAAESSPPCENFPEAFHPGYGEPGFIMLFNVAKSLCNECPIREQCLEYAIKWETQGIWGGVASRDRQRMRQQLKSLGHKLPDLETRTSEGVDEAV